MLAHLAIDSQRWFVGREGLLCLGFSHRQCQELVVNEVCFTLRQSRPYETLGCSTCLPYLLFSLQCFTTLPLLWLLPCTLLQATSIFTNSSYSTAWREKPVKL